MTDDRLSRRSVLRLVVLGGALTAAAGTLLEACGGGAPVCTDTRGLSPAELTTRTGANYVETSPDAAKKCSGCNFFHGAAANACGTCTVLKGPINPNGNCRLWVVKA